MAGEKVIIGARLRAEREDRGWSRPEMARRLRAASREALPDGGSLTHMIKEWERGKHLVSGRYRSLFAAALATSFRGYVARQQGRPRAVVRAASAALATPGVHVAQKTFDTFQAAQGYAALGEGDKARRLLDTAAELAEDVTEPPPPIYWYSRPFFRLNIGVVQAGIGEYRDAADMLGGGLAEMPPDQRAAEWLREYEDAFAAAKERT